MNHFHRQHHPAANAAVPALMVTATLVASGLLFYFITFSGDDPDQATPAQTPAQTHEGGTAAGPGTAVTPETPAPVQPVAPAPPVEVDPVPPPPAAVVQTPFRQPQPLAEALRDALIEADAEELGAMLGSRNATDEEASAATGVLGGWLEQLQAAEWIFEPLELIGRQGSEMRFRLPLGKVDPVTGEAFTEAIEFELRRQPDLTWQLHGLNVGPGLGGDMLAEGLAALTPERPEDDPPSPVVRVLDGQPDALAVARQFLQSLLRQDYESARRLVATDRVAAERLAGLCIVFEEGNYREVPDQLVATAVEGGRAWVVAQVRSEAAEVSTELGIEMEQSETAEGEAVWLVSGLNLSQLLSNYASASGDTPYVPIVEHPSGGESLVLFFEFDDADLHARAKRQLDIVARLLMADETKTIRITGHTDARGTGDYNQRLSLSRAERVRLQLLDLGVPVAQIKTEGFGPERPLSPNITPDGEDNPLGRARNRRAEIYLDF